MEAIATPPCKAIIQLVLERHPRQQLYLLGSTEVRQKTSTVFRQDHPSCMYTGHYYLLSLVHGEEPPPDVLQDTIENTLSEHAVAATVLVINLSQFNRWLADAHPFALAIYRKATLLHDAGYLLAQPDPAHVPRPFNETVYAKGRRMAQLFFAGAEFYRHRNDNDFAFFMLHQCAEQALRTLLAITTGYCPHTHNIDKLLRYCSMTVHKLTEVFHSRTPQQERLYRRYKTTGYTRNDAEEVTRKVKILMRLLKEYGKQPL